MDTTKYEAVLTAPPSGPVLNQLPADLVEDLFEFGKIRYSHHNGNLMYFRKASEVPPFSRGAEPFEVKALGDRKASWRLALLRTRLSPDRQHGRVKTFCWFPDNDTFVVQSPILVWDTQPSQPELPEEPVPEPVAIPPAADGELVMLTVGGKTMEFRVPTDVIFGLALDWVEAGYRR
jgi:hypothetical protein